MTTLNQSILPIPEATVQGSGGYTMPANKYGLLDYTCVTNNMHTLKGKNTTLVGFFSSSDATSSTHTSQFSRRDMVTQGKLELVAGDTITISLNSPIDFGTGNIGNYNPAVTYGIDKTSYARLLLNAVIVAQARIVVRGIHNVGGPADTFMRQYSEASVGWSAAEFPIPINNLPEALIVK